jgi:hypothetical protein
VAALLLDQSLPGGRIGDGQQSAVRGVGDGGDGRRNRRHRPDGSEQH